MEMNDSHYHELISFNEHLFCASAREITHIIYYCQHNHKKECTEPKLWMNH